MRALAGAAALLLAASLASAQIPSSDGDDHSTFSSLPAAIGAIMGEPMLKALEPAAPALLSSGTAAAVSDFELSTAAKAGMLDAARGIFVEVRFKLAPYDASSGIDKSRFWKRSEAWTTEEAAQNREAITVIGSRAPGPGIFAAPLFDYNLDRLEGLAVVDAEGRPHPARPWGVPRRGDAVWFSADGLKSVPLPALRETAGLKSGQAARLTKFNDDLQLSLLSWEAERRYDPGVDTEFRRGHAKAKELRGQRIEKEIELVFDSSGSWRGWLADYDARVVLSPTALSGQAVAWEEFVERLKAARQGARRTLPVLHLRFRPEREDAAAAFLYDKEHSLKERFEIGYPLSAGVVFSPRSLSVALVKRLESVELLLDGKARPARFIGVLNKDVAGYLVAPEKELTPLDAVHLPEDGELALGVEPYAASSTMQVWAYPDRIEGSEPGYDGVQRPKPRALEAVGGLLAGLDGRPAALMVEEIRRESVIDQNEWRKPRPLVRLHPIAELARAFARPEDAVDPLLKPDASAGAKRRAWLGVETQDIDADLAKLLGLSGPTRGGTQGQLVNAVLPGSPAARAGLKPGDALLLLREAGKREDAVIPGRVRPAVAAPAINRTVDFFRRPATGLDDALAELSPGTPVRLTYARDGKERAAEVILAESPPDIETSPRLVDAGTGLSLKELTDDVRRLLRLPHEFRGLLIYDVEFGSPARVADLQAFGLLTEFDGKAVSTLSELESLLAARRAAGASTVKVRSLYLGKPLYVDLRIAAEPAPPSQGGADR